MGEGGELARVCFAGPLPNPPPQAGEGTQARASAFELPVAEARVTELERTARGRDNALLHQVTAMTTSPVPVGIVGLGRWAKVLTRAARKSDALKIVAGYSRSEEKRAAFAREFGVAVDARPRHAAGRSGDQGRDPHGAERAAPAGRARGREGRQARLHREADRQHARGRPRDRGAGEDLRRHRHGRPQRAADGGHPPHPRGDRRRRARPRRLHGGELLQRARARAHAEDVALVQGPGAGRAAVAARHPSVRRAALSRRRDRRGQLDGVEALAGRRRGRRPVDDAR